MRKLFTRIMAITVISLLWVMVVLTVILFLGRERPESQHIPQWTPHIAAMQTAPERIQKYSQYALNRAAVVGLIAVAERAGVHNIDEIVVLERDPVFDMYQERWGWFMEEEDDNR